MTDDHMADNPPDLPKFSFDRTGAHVEVEPCPDGDYWHWLWIPNDPPETMKVPTQYVEMTPEGPMPHYEEQPWEPVVQHIEAKALLGCLSPEETNLFLGWCSHVHEQLGAHLNELADAVKLAVEERRWEGVSKIAEDLHSSCTIRANVEAAGRTAFELT